MDSYRREIQKILGDRNTIAVYPVDVGDTLRMLCASLQSEEDQKELMQTKEQVLSDLRNAIIRQKGERLRSVLADLRAIVENYGADELCSIQEKIADYTNKIRDKYQLIDLTRQNLTDLQGEDGEQVALKMKMAALSEAKSQIISLKFIENLPVIADPNSQFFEKDRRGRYLKDDPNKKFLEMLREKVTSEIQKFYASMVAAMKETDLKVEITLGEMIRKIDGACILIRENELYPLKKGLFSRMERVYEDQIKSICESIQVDVNRQLACYGVAFLSQIDFEIQQIRVELNRVKQSIENQNKKIQKYYGEISELNYWIQALKRSKQEIELQKEQDRKTLEMYLDQAEEAFLEQRNVVVAQINASETVSDKILLILFLGILDRNYQTVIGGIYENQD